MESRNKRATVGLMAGAAIAGVGIGAERARRSRRSRLRRDRRRYRLRSGEPLPAALHRILDGRFEVAIAELECRGGDRARAVHDARTAIKRLRSALRLVRDALGEKRYRDVNAELRAAAHALARARDAVAVREALEDLAERYRELVDPDELSRLRDRLGDDDAAAAQGLDGAAADALVALRRARASLAEWPDERSRVSAGSSRAGSAEPTAGAAPRSGRRCATRAPRTSTRGGAGSRISAIRRSCCARSTRRRCGSCGGARDACRTCWATLTTSRRCTRVADDAPITAELAGRRSRELRDEAFEIGGRLYAAPPRRVARRLRRRAAG